MSEPATAPPGEPPKPAEAAKPEPPSAERPQRAPDASRVAQIQLNVETTRALIQKSKAQIQMALPKHLSVERLMRVAMTSIQRTPRLAECSPISLLASVMQCAQLGLEPDGVTGMAYLVPYWNSKRGVFEAQFQPGYKGLMDLAFRSEQVLKFDAHAVYTKDEFTYSYGAQPYLMHQPYRAGHPGEVIATYALAWIKDAAEPLFRVCERWEIDQARGRSKSKDEGPWVTDFDAMAMKTAIRRLCKLLRQTPELARAVALDELAEADKPQGLEILVAPDTIEGQVVAPAASPGPQVQRQQTPAAAKPAAGVISEPQLKRLFALMKGHHTNDELKAYLLETYKIADVQQIPKQHYDAIVKWASGGQ
jgi:recombination protein RecT